MSVKNKDAVIASGTIWYFDGKGERHQFTSVLALLQHVARCGGYYQCGTDPGELRMVDTDDNKLYALKLTNGVLVPTEVTNP